MPTSTKINKHDIDLTASDVGAMRVYKTLEEIGVTTDVSKVTMTEILNALPSYSELIVRVDTSWNKAEFPTLYSTLNAVKHEDYERCYAFLINTNSAELCFGSMNSTDSTFAGWKEVFTTEGGTLSGGLTLQGADYTNVKLKDIVANTTSIIEHYGKVFQITLQGLNSEDSLQTVKLLMNCNPNSAIDEKLRLIVNDNWYKIYGEHNKPTAADIGAAASSHTHGAGDINSGTLPVARGGTGGTTFTAGQAIIGNGTGAFQGRAITNNTSNANLAGTNLVTANSVNYHGRYWLNRSNRVTDADANYTTYMARGVALVTAVPTSMTNGCVAFVYA